MSTSDPRWEAFAAREPHFAVLTAPRFLQANLTPESEREFFVSGEATVAWILAVIDAGLAPGFAPMTILEYGCGIGRLAMPLARRAARRGGTVTAIDRSPAMLAIARQQAARHSVANITFGSPIQLFATPCSFGTATAKRRWRRFRCGRLVRHRPSDEPLNCSFSAPECGLAPPARRCRR